MELVLFKGEAGVKGRCELAAVVRRCNVVQRDTDLAALPKQKGVVDESWSSEEET